MRFTETDPIPGAPVVPFRRNYDSRVPESGWFGPGTTTFLDPRLYVSAEGAESAAYISLMDEDGHAYVFEKKLDTYVQFSPRPGSRPTRLLHDANGEWRHVNSDGRIARVESFTFHATTGQNLLHSVTGATGQPVRQETTEVRPLGGTTVYGYDSRSRVVTVSRGPSATNLLERIETVYDIGTGKKSVDRLQAYEGGAWVFKKSDWYGYDTEARMTILGHGDSTEVHYTYDARDQVLTVQDENHTTPNTFYTYDPSGRLALSSETTPMAQKRSRSPQFVSPASRSTAKPPHSTSPPPPAASRVARPGSPMAPRRSARIEVGRAPFGAPPPSEPDVRISRIRLSSW
ncbi:MAG: hypothetical protein QOH21_247 [Acidobacteriota bacterium]|jgi:YD repeat-containing protein|nr:hypothetical protein [Acidobacteriota bacterium]